MKSSRIESGPSWSLVSVFDLSQDVAGVRFDLFYVSQVLFGLNNFNNTVMFQIYYGCVVVDAGSCLGWAANSVCWDTEFQDGFPVIILGMNYVQETKKMVVYIGKAYMMEDSYHWLMLRFLLVTYRLRSWYDPHLLIHSFASGLMRCQVKMSFVKESCASEVEMSISLAAWYIGFVIRKIHDRGLDKRGQRWISCLLMIVFQRLFLSSQAVGLWFVIWYILRRQVGDQVLDILINWRGLCSVQDGLSLIPELSRNVVHRNVLSKFLVWICSEAWHGFVIACYKLVLLAIFDIYMVQTQAWDNRQVGVLSRVPVLCICVNVGVDMRNILERIMLKHNGRFKPQVFLLVNVTRPDIN